MISAQGLSFNYKTFQFARTGGMYLDFTPSGSQIEIDGVVRDYSNVIGNFFSSGAFFDNLLPGSYDVTVTYPGYSPWEKNLQIEPGVVTAASQIILWPVNWSAKKISEYNASAFWLTGNGLVIKDATGTLLLGDQKVKGSSVVLSSERRSIIVTGDAKDYYVMDLANAPRYADVELPAGASIKYWSYHPFDQNSVIAIGNKAVYAINISSGASQKLYSLPDNQYSYAKGNEIFVAEENGNIFSANLFLRTQITLATGIKDMSDIKTTSLGSTLFLTDIAHKLYEYDRSNQTTTSLETLLPTVREIYVSPDDDRLALVADNGSLSMLAVNDYRSDYQVQKGTFWSVKTDYPVSDFIWIPYAPNYGVILEGGNLVLSELDERMPQNQYKIDSGVSAVSLSGDQLYFLKSGSLFEVTLK